MMTSSLGIAPLLKPVEALNKKWLDRDPQNTLTQDCLVEWYNELLNEKEIYIRPDSVLNRDGFASHKSGNGHYYCGQATLHCDCCNGVCGPSFGCNCKSCQEIEDELKENKDLNTSEVFLLREHIEAWSWGQLPTLKELKNFTKLVSHKQLALFKKSTESITFLQNLKSRVYVHSRFLSVYSRTCFGSKKKDKSNQNKESPTQITNISRLPATIESESEFVHSGLFILFKSIFKFLKTSWEDGVRNEFCTELLEEALSMFKGIHKPLLTTEPEKEQSKLLIGFLDYTSNFLADIIRSSADETRLPISDRKSILILMFEIAFQTASLSGLVKVISLYLQLCQDGILTYLSLNGYIQKLMNQLFQMDFVPEIISKYYNQSLFGNMLLESMEFFKSLNEADSDCDEKCSNIVKKLMKVLMSIIQPFSQVVEDEKPNSKAKDELVWGNLKLLSSLKEEKMTLKIATICCTDTLVIILTLNGKIFCCEHNNETLDLKPYKQVEGLKITQLSCSFDGHFIALTNDGTILTWRDVNNIFEHMSPVPLKIGGKVSKLFSGFGYYAAVTDQDEVCIWENTLIGRANHDQHHTQFLPRTFTEFENNHVIDIVFSQYHPEVIIVTKGGKIWSWENGTEFLLSENYPNTIKIYIAKYFYVALTDNGQVYRWGRDQFGKSTVDSHIEFQPVVKIRNENIVSLSVGAYHCIAITDSSNVYCWGGLGGKEEDETLIREPVLLKVVSELGVSRVVAGPHQIFCWDVSFMKKLEKQVPFAIDLKQDTFVGLEQLLTFSQNIEDEELKNILMQSCLSLLKLQFNAARIHDVEANALGFDGKTDFSRNLKLMIIEFISSLPYHSTLHKLAEEVLAVGWLFLLPTAKERATTFSMLLKIKSEGYTENHSFLLQLLMKCLLEKNGLEELLEDVISSLLLKRKDNDFDPSQNTLFVLLKELFLVNTGSILKIKTSVNKPEKIEQEILKVLLKFQRLLFARVFVVTEKDVCWPARCYVYEPTPMVKSLTTVVSLYITLIQCSCKQIFTFHNVTKLDQTVLQNSPCGLLFQEFIVYLIILQNYAPIITSNCDTFAQFADLLDLFDQFNKSMSDNENVISSDMAWPCTQPVVSSSNTKETTEEEIENKQETKEKATTTSQLIDDITSADTLADFVGREVSSAIADVLSSDQMKTFVKENAKDDEKLSSLTSRKNSETFRKNFLQTEQSIAFLLGLHCCYLAHGTYASHDETENKIWLHSVLFAAGVNRETVLKDIKPQCGINISIQHLLQKNSEPVVKTLMDKVFEIAHEKKIIVVPIPDSDVDSMLELTTRSIFASMVFHSGLDGELPVLLNENHNNKEISQDMTAVIKATVKLRASIFQMHQELQTPYEEMCKPIYSKCVFLCNCLNASQKPSKSHLKEKWDKTVRAVCVKYGYKWNFSKWRINSLQNKKLHQRRDILKKVHNEIGQFVLDKKLSIDILRKCFLIQIKRAKQRLISGYLMQSLCLRQTLFRNVRYALMCGWLGLLVPGGSVSHAKPNILFNVELVPKDDIDKLKDVFHGFENFLLKAMLDELELLKDSHDENDILQSSRNLLLSFTLLSSSVMSGDTEFMVLCGVLEKSQHVLSQIMKVKSSKNVKTESVPFIDERKHRKIHLQELDGDEISKLMKIGSRVVRGPDWKWDDQDGPHPSQGRVVSEIGEDGWVRIEWDTGSRNSYRMGKNGKYDLKLADTVQYFDEDDKEDIEKDASREKDDTGNQLEENPISLVTTSITSFLVNILSRSACKEVFKSNTVNAVTKFLIQSLKDVVEKSISAWGPDISVSAYFGFCRALCVSPEIQEVVSVKDWITLLLKMFDLAVLLNNFATGGNAFLIKIQLLKHIRFLLGCKNRSYHPVAWKNMVLESLFKNLIRLLQSDAIFTAETRQDHTTKASMAASPSTTVAEEIITLIHHLHVSNDWTDMINLKIWKKLRMFDYCIKSDRIYLQLISALSIIGGIDSRIRIGGLVEHEKYGRGTCVDILPNGKILLYFGTSLKPRLCHLSKLNIIPQSSINLHSIVDYQKKFSLFEFLLEVAFKGPAIKWESNFAIDLDKWITYTRLYVFSLCSLKLLFNNPEILLKTMNEQKNVLMFSKLMEKALSSSPIQTTFDVLELEMASLSLAEEITLPNKKSKDNTTSKFLSDAADGNKVDTPPVPTTRKDEETTTLVNKTSEMINSNPMLKLLVEMGFPVAYIDHAMKELGEGARPEQLVSWLLQHPDLKEFEQRGIDNNKAEKRRVSLPSNNSGGNMEQEHEDIVSTIEAAAIFGLPDTTSSKFPLGCLVKTIHNPDKNGLGTVLKVIGSDENILVYWEMHNKALWTTSDKIKLYDETSKSNKRKGGIQEGSHVKLKSTTSTHQYSMTPVLRNRIGTVTFIHPNDEDCTVAFDQLPLWHGSVQDLELVGPVHLHVTCNGCEMKPVIGIRYKCKSCEDFDFCENCFSNRTDHSHNFFAYHRSRSGQQPVEAGTPGQSRIEWCRSIPDKHQSIKEIIVSSNEHIAAKMINQEMNLPWISEKGFGPHYIYLTLHPHILIKNISVVLDIDDNETYPSRFTIYAGSSKNQKQMVEDIKLKGSKTLIKLLDRQEEIYTYIDIKVFVGDGSTESACKICHLNVSGERRRKDYDQLIMKMICSIEKKYDMTEQVSYMKEQEHGFTKQKNVNKQVKAFCWGLNDKDQLGGLKGSKIKSPTVSQKLSSLNCKSISGGSKTLYCVTYNGQVYSCGEAAYGRLGLGSVTGNVSIPCLIDAFKGYVVRKVAVHPGGKHCLAITTNGECFSWGEGDDGKLGHGDKVSYSTPRLIESFIGKHVTNISCGSSHSAAIVSNKELYTWGLGDYGRLGHGDEETQLVPKLVTGLTSYNVTDISCGSRDAQTIALTDDGNVWSWGDGDFGKLGRGGSEGCLSPATIPTLTSKSVCKILCGAQFSLALTKTGQMWTWGKGDFYRLGHGNDLHHREPRIVESLEGKQIVDVAVGALHCLAVTDEGEVYAWGDNDHGQQGTGSTTVNKTPTRLLGTDGHRIQHVACGSSHSIAWAETNIVSNILDDVIRFSPTCDPLGTSIVLQKHPFNPPVGNIAKIMKDQRPSLVRTVLQIHSNILQKEALQKILKAIEINFSRSMIIHCLKSVKTRPELYSQHWINELRTVSVQSLIQLLKLSLCGHMQDGDAEILEQFLKDICYKNLEVSNCLIDTCIKELEGKIAYNLIMQEKYKPCVQESSHPYQGAPGAKLSGSVKYPGASMLHVEFNEQCQTEAGHDVLTFYDHSGRTLAVRTGHLSGDWNTKLKVTGDELNWSFTTNSPGGLWGFSFVVTPMPPADDVDLDSVSDNGILKMPCLELVKKLLGIGIKNGSFNEMTILKLASLLATCMRIKLISFDEKKWILNQLHLLLLSPSAPAIDVPLIFNCSHFQDATVCKLRLNGNQQIHDAVMSSTLVEFITGIPQALLKQYEFEEGHVRSGDQLMFSSFLRGLALFACSLGVDALPVCNNKYRWAWFHKYCYAVRTAQSFIQNTELPKSFSVIVREKLADIKLSEESLCLDYENNDLFCKAQDEQILMWLKRRSQDWSVIWGGSGTIYGWGHNHRGQLGGVEGARIKHPTVCDSLAALKPVQIVGGEQSLFCVTGDGRVYATGYGNSSRLGLGIIESVSVPRMIESLQHISIKKVSVHSGGRHCLALSTDGEVFSWGEGDDGKLGHGTRISSNHPKLIETFRGKVMSDIATGGSHSAAISEIGELFSWGKGRYGRLGHGDGEDQLRPKLVEALQDLCVIDVACGSGDAQTLCITSNDMVWSWGDGDYGKLGRGGSDGCKVPLVIDDLTGKSIVKVECGSQFSMALSRHGVLYTWGKGDYYRLGHGTEDHVRRPKRVLVFEAKVVTSICCGSLHCVACTEDGEVYCWGDNDEGQLGDNTTYAGQQPKLCIGLQNKKIDRIACGSAHTISWSTCESGGHSLPLQVPIEYNHLHDLHISTIRNRALLLHSFSKLFCSCIPLMDLIEDCEVSCGGEKMINSLKGVLLCSFKENFFRKIIDLTMVRDRQHGPVVELNRVKKHRTERNLVEPDASKSVFVQITSKISEFSFDSFCLPHRIWKVKFIGESVDDCGGGFSESIAEMCDELQNGTLPLLIPAPNSEEETDSPSDYFLINPNANEKQHKEMFRFFGLILGIAIRCGSPLNLRLAEPMWKLLVGVELNMEDLEDIDRGFVSKHSYLSTLSSDNITIETYSNNGENCTPISYDHVATLELPFTVRSASTKEVQLSPCHKYITRENRQEYLRESLHYRLNEFNKQIQWIRTGLSQVVPVPLLSLFTGPELENMVCGNPEIPVEALKSITSYRGIEPTSTLVKWFWQTLEDFTNHERSLFLRFVWGRTRLPRTAMDFKGKDFIFQVLDKYNPPDYYLPESYTCFFLLKMPRYTSMEILKEKLKYAIYFCKSIDSDDYARIDLMH